MENLINKAKVLMEALPYLQKFKGKRFIFKYGGHAMEDEELKKGFCLDIILLKLIGIHPIIVHGGGPQIEKVLSQMGIEAKFHNGLRITDSNTMDVVEMVLVGKVNKEIVGSINHFGGRAIGLSGKDGNLILANKMDPQQVKKTKRTSEIIDLGLVGDVAKINPQILTILEDSWFIPVIAPVGVSDAGISLNINADNVAAAVAVALNAEKLLLMTDVDGVKNQKENLIPKLNIKETKDLITKGIATGGMIPKLNCALDALSQGVKTVHIFNGTMQHAILLEIFTDQGVGTLIEP
ncbi:MAG: acetylglutamate kinase [Deltaproteobacteria bacterium RIFCSPLOWO2_12_FULL_40_28]|nr:MAG: acetylglutamate kinase [Deltaproteobacteria bacterium RIFCSPHIGHO2_02_FULL_40_28]OGQ20898.1 MAG: acetylglutamate kinase [Deltaproteobacteria bacterium RIFCSPHIGHO2_12_FULL_40_32]OGQ39299.1 MAG: acetylglutamate kinase [Deltaproteobacteria bacterium RIFCSPLOWO2_02_FULL_40_36]OGQ54580.1 MAG: acetylglutamate kinase [Deltaproteobacteria bacterium RIFCSPLOWO2_12_FULL_40_28]